MLEELGRFELLPELLAALAVASVMGVLWLRRRWRERQLTRQVGMLSREVAEFRQRNARLREVEAIVDQAAEGLRRLKADNDDNPQPRDRMA